MDGATHNFENSVEFDERDEIKEEPVQRIQSALLGHANERWETAKQNHNMIEERLLESLRRRRGVYSDEKLAAIQAQSGSEVFMQITGIKCRAAAAWIKNVMFQPGERLFSIDSTPDPDQDQKIESLLQQIADQYINSTGERIGEAEAEQARKYVEKEVMDELKTRTEKMAVKIEDQLIEGGFDYALHQVIDDICTFQAGFLKGPILRRKMREKWIQSESGWNLDRQPEFVMEWERVSPFDMFPAPDAKSVNDSWLIERHRISRNELRSFMQVPGFDPDAINDVLTEFQTGREEYISGDSNRERLESTTSNQAYQSETVDGFELWDSVSGEMLLNWDAGRGLIEQMQIDPYEEYEINLWVIASHIIKVDLADDSSLNRNYYSACYDAVPGSLWGNSIPDIMRDVQDVCNGCARALVNNMGVASGPQVGIDVDKMPAGEDLTAMYPWKQWQINGDVSRALTFFNPPSNAEELMRIYEYFSNKADEYTGIPSFAYGQSDARGAGATASGLSMLMSSASNGIKSVIGQIDRNVIEPAIRRMYQFNMMHSDDESIKGDAQVVSMGAKSLMVKEQMQQRRMEFMQSTLNDVDMQILGVEGRADLLRESAKALDLPHTLIPPNDEISARMQDESNAAQ